MNHKIGIELHVQLNLAKTKLFCSCPIKLDSEPNRFVCPICLALPGAMPCLKEDPAEKFVQLGRLLNLEKVNNLIFKRKHYRYHDLPAGFQRTQNKKYVFAKGLLETYDSELKEKTNSVMIDHIILEEDPAATLKDTSLDFNRAGTPLVEIVTQPVFKTPEEIINFIKTVLKIVEFNRLTDTRVPGAYRADVNISTGNEFRAEIKNLSSFKEITLAVKKEIERQNKTPLLQNETRAYDFFEETTIFSRKKESESDYFYLNEKDLPLNSLSKFFNKPGLSNPFNHFESLKKLLNRELAWTLLSYPVFLEKVLEKGISGKHLIRKITDLIHLLKTQENLKIDWPGLFNENIEAKLFLNKTKIENKIIEEKEAFKKEEILESLKEDEFFIKSCKNYLENKENKLKYFLIGRIKNKIENYISFEELNQLLETFIRKYVICT